MSEKKTKLNRGSGSARLNALRQRGRPSARMIHWFGGIYDVARPSGAAMRIEGCDHQRDAVRRYCQYEMGNDVRGVLWADHGISPNK